MKTDNTRQNNVQMQSYCSKDYQAYAIMLAAGLFYVVGYMNGAQNKKLNIGTINLWRGLSTVLINYAVIWYSGKTVYFIKEHDFQLLNKRSLAMSFQGVCLSMSLYYLSPSTVYTINSSGPVLVFLVDYLRNGAKVTGKQLSGIIIGFMSILITINSNLIMKMLGYTFESPSEFHYIQTSLTVVSFVSLALFLVQFSVAYGIILTKEIHTQDAFQIGFHFGFSQVIFSAILNFFFDQSSISFAQTINIILMISIPLGISNIGMNVALKMSNKSGNISMMMFNNVVIGYFISLFRYGETPNLVAIIGSVCIFISLLLVLIK